MLNENRTRLALVSGNMFGRDPWAHHSAALWFELSQMFGEVHVFARSRDQKFARFSRGDVTIHLIPRGPKPMATFLVSSWMMLILLWRSRPTHIQAQSPVHGGLAAVTYGRVAGVPVMVEVHGEHYLRYRPKGRWAHWLLYRPLTALTFRGATRIRSLSPEMTAALVHVYGARAGRKVVEIPNRVDLARFSPPLQDYVGGATLRLVSVGALVANKNHVALIRDLAACGLDISLTLVGSGPMEAAIRAAAAEAGVPLSLTGNVTHNELPRILRDHDVYVHYSRSEAVSRAVLEAMALGLPVVVSDVGFLGGIVDHMRSGYVLGSNGRDLCSALQALDEAELREQLGAEGLRRIQQSHEWRAVLAHHVQSLLSMNQRHWYRAV